MRVNPPTSCSDHFFICSVIWEKFVEFEAGVGDLASLLKVERRRAATIKPEVGLNLSWVMMRV